MEDDHESWRQSVREPPPPYVDDDSRVNEPPVSPTAKRRSRWSLSSASAHKPGSYVDDPSLSLNPANLETKLQTSDLKFAKVVLQLMAPKLEEGHLSYLEGSGWGYTFSDDTVNNPDYKKSQLDKLLGFNAFAYRKRFRKVEELAWRELEMRGFEVKLLEICVSDLAIGVKWIIDI